MNIENLNIVEDLLDETFMIQHINYDTAIELFHMLTELRRNMLIMDTDLSVLNKNIDLIDSFITKYCNEPFASILNFKICLN